MPELDDDIAGISPLQKSLGMIPTAEQEALQSPLIGPETYGLQNLLKKGVGVGVLGMLNLSPSDLYKHLDEGTALYQQALKESAKFYVTHAKKYGTDTTKWPKDIADVLQTKQTSVYDILRTRVSPYEDAIKDIEKGMAKQLEPPLPKMSPIERLSWDLGKIVNKHRSGE